MKNALQGLVLLVMIVAILVAGYYLGIALAITMVVITSIGIACVFLTFIGFAIWELLGFSKSKKRPLK